MAAACQKIAKRSTLWADRLMLVLGAISGGHEHYKKEKASMTTASVEKLRSDVLARDILKMVYVDIYVLCSAKLSARSVDDSLWVTMMIITKRKAGYAL